MEFLWRLSAHSENCQPSRLSSIKRFLTSNKQSLAQQFHFISTAILLILLLEITFSLLCFLEFKFIGKCLEDIGDLDLSHAISYSSQFHKSLLVSHSQNSLF